MTSFHLSGFGRRYDILGYTLVIDKFRRGRLGCGSTWSDGHSGLHALSLSTTELEATRIILDHYIILVTRRRGFYRPFGIYCGSGNRPTRYYLI
ncbi:hypothetical protein K443DRAFT_593931 [Laccaria amethystina LaAM-08-1]|uniref:Uncharacterized protein n=1 Tax=Laccaria amethystina LaAM-08-1 TaxID=1095629 RepID=A0A0C9XYG4_9AGAR|nr:hypothetical protein K443DRAFT_593931 [Laccaria amethystina LaAM-08-1]